MAEITLFDGIVDVKRIPPITPVGCTNKCESPYSPMLVGCVKTDTGFSNICNFEDVLERLNGQYIKVIIQTEASHE
jgi:hypothetical protein